jgi:small subunit ribosomal protein S20
MILPYGSERKKKGHVPCASRMVAYGALEPSALRCQYKVKIRAEASIVLCQTLFLGALRLTSKPVLVYALLSVEKEGSMPIHKSPEKRMRQDKKRSLRNKAVMTEIKSATKKVRQSTNPAEAAEAFKKCASLMDKAAKRSIFHKSTVNRTKSRLAKAVNKLAASQK